jgi:hypothetical protein
MNQRDLLSDEQFFCLLGGLFDDDPSVDSFETDYGKRLCNFNIVPVPDFRNRSYFISLNGC